MKLLKIFLFLTLSLMMLSSTSEARGGGHGGGGRGHSGGRVSGRGPSGIHPGGPHVGAGGHSIRVPGSGFRGWSVPHYSSTYRGSGPYFWFGGWPYYYPPVYYYYPPPVYEDSKVYPYPPLDYAPFPLPVESPNFVKGDPIFIYPRQGQTQEQQLKDLSECQTQAKIQIDALKFSVGVSSTESEDYNRALGVCMDGRGYSTR